MPLTSGTKIGFYEIGALLGVGGMGEVYRSRDSKLGREVALKVLPSGVAADPDRLGRFSREAKLLAALNHPNIASIYGLEDSGATHALVMELVEGPTLAERIHAGPIPADEALPLAKQICEALEYKGTQLIAVPLMLQFEGGRAAIQSQATVVLNWLPEVRRLVDSGQSSPAK